MKKIYEVRNVRDLYTILRRNYDFALRDFKIAEAPLSTFHNFRRDLKESSNNYLNFAFAYKYVDQCEHCYHITCANTDINLYILMDKKITPSIKKRVFQNMYRVSLLCKLYGISTPTQGQERCQFNFYILMNPLKRYMPAKKDDPIDAVNVNGGYTYINKNNIYIIRKEDYEKVMLHELLHHNTMTHHEDWNDVNIERLKEHFKIHCDMLLLPNEAIIEVFACILNTIFYTIETGTRLNENLKRDQEHSLHLAKKLLDKQGDGVWNEKTHSFCYIVIKTIIYVYCNKFLQIYRYRNDTAMTDFILQYSQKINKRLRRLGRPERPSRTELKQTVYG